MNSNKESFYSKDLQIYRNEKCITFRLPIKDESSLLNISGDVKQLNLFADNERPFVQNIQEISQGQAAGDDMQMAGFNAHLVYINQELQSDKDKDHTSILNNIIQDYATLTQQMQIVLNDKEKEILTLRKEIDRLNRKLKKKP